MVFKKDITSNEKQNIVKFLIDWEGNIGNCKKINQGSQNNKKKNENIGKISNRFFNIQKTDFRKMKIVINKINKKIYAEVIVDNVVRSYGNI